MFSSKIEQKFSPKLETAPNEVKKRIKEAKIPPEEQEANFRDILCVLLIETKRDKPEVMQWVKNEFNAISEPAGAAGLSGSGPIRSSSSGTASRGGSGIAGQEDRETKNVAVEPTKEKKLSERKSSSDERERKFLEGKERRPSISTSLSPLILLPRDSKDHHVSPPPSPSEVRREKELEEDMKEKEKEKEKEKGVFSALSPLRFFKKDKEEKKDKKKEKEEEDKNTDVNVFSHDDVRFVEPDKVFDLAEKLLVKENPKNIYTLKRRYGKGSFGTVWEAKENKTQQTIALKVLHKPFSESSKDVLNEIFIMKNNHQKNIVTIIDAYLWNDQLSIGLEFCEGGPLSQVILRWELLEEDIAFIAREVLQGLEYLHAKKLIHRDIKSDNILVTRQGEIKIADFGLIAQLKDDDDKKTSVVGSRNWMAPEIIKRIPYNYKVDIWSLGGLVVEVLTKSPPNACFSTTNFKVLYHTATKGAPALATRIGKRCSDFLCKCFQVDFNQRPSSTELLQHPFLAKAVNSSELVKAIQITFLTNSYAI